jgi:hypothetical protein
MYGQSPFFCTGAKFGPLKKGDKKTDIKRDEIFQKNSRYTLFDHKRSEEIWEEMKVELND